MSLTVPTFKQPVCSTTAFGRVFYGVSSFVYYSQVLVVPKTSGACYQINDPTSEEIPDILSTDGGRIEIDEAINIFKIFPYRGGILVFASNGVWYVWGPDNGFSADNFTITKVTERVLNYTASVLQAEGSVFFLTNSGIQQITTTELNYPVSEDITETSIRSWYLDNLEGKNCTGEYREKEKQIWWCSNTDGTILVHDLRVPAFYPQKNAGSNQIQRGVSTGQSFVFSNYWRNGNTLGYNFATDTSSDFKDFGTDQISYLVSSYETLGKFSNKKSAPYAKVYFNKTETTITGYDEENKTYTYDFPSACMFQARWDFDSSNVYNKWVGRTTRESGSGKKMNLYSPLQRGFIPDAFPYTFDTGESVISKKIKIRGNGDAVQFRFEAQPEKDMQILGYNVKYTMKGSM